MEDLFQPLTKLVSHLAYENRGHLRVEVGHEGDSNVNWLIVERIFMPCAAVFCRLTRLLELPVNDPHDTWFN